MKLYFLIIVFFIGLQGIAQIDTLSKPNKVDVRVVVGVPLAYPFVAANLLFSAEYKTARIPISVLAKVGPTLNNGETSPPFTGLNAGRSASFNFLLAVEGRYYFLLSKKYQQYYPQIRNWGPYVGIEQQLLTNYWAKTADLPPLNAEPGRVSTFLNVGWQKQFNRFYINTSFGVALFQKSLENNPGIHLDDTQSYVGLGWLLNKRKKADKYQGNRF